MHRIFLISCSKLVVTLSNLDLYMHQFFTRFLLAVIVLFFSLQTVARDYQNDKNRAFTAPLVMKDNVSLISFTIEKIINKGSNRSIIFKLFNNKTEKPVTLDDLVLVHTQKMHALIIDDSLEDYSHVHPQTTNKPGNYLLSWTAKRDEGNYTLWLEIVPKATNKKITFSSILPFGEFESAVIDRTTVMTTEMNGFKFKLSFDIKPQAGKAIIGTVDIYPTPHLQPVMGAYAHIVAFSDDLKTLVHIHPMGRDPLRFHIQPEKPGFIKLFVQVNINNQELFVPFSFMVGDN